MSDVSHTDQSSMIDCKARVAENNPFPRFASSPTIGTSSRCNLFVQDSHEAAKHFLSLPPRYKEHLLLERWHKLGHARVLYEYYSTQVGVLKLPFLMKEVPSPMEGASGQSPRLHRV